MGHLILVSDLQSHYEAIHGFTLDHARAVAVLNHCDNCESVAELEGMQEREIISLGEFEALAAAWGEV